MKWKFGKKTPNLKLRKIIFIKIQTDAFKRSVGFLFWACPAEKAGRAIRFKSSPVRSSRLWAFHFYPSHKRFHKNVFGFQDSYIRNLVIPRNEKSPRVALQRFAYWNGVTCGDSSFLRNDKLYGYFI